MPPQGCCHSVWHHCILYRHSFTDLMVRTHWWPRILCTTSFSFLEKKCTQDVFCWWRSSEFISFSLGGIYFLSVSCQPSKAWNVVTAFSSKPCSYGLDILWLTMYWGFLPLSVELLSNTMDARVSAVLPCSPVVKRRKMYAYVFSYTEDGKGWGVWLILFVFSTGSFPTFHILYITYHS